MIIRSFEVGEAQMPPIGRRSRELTEGEFPEIVGTICGDDTIFVACRSAGDGKLLARKLGTQAAGGLH